MYISIYILLVYNVPKTIIMTALLLSGAAGLFLNLLLIYGPKFPCAISKRQVTANIDKLILKTGITYVVMM